MPAVTKKIKKQKYLKTADCEVLEVNEKDGFVDLKNLMEILGQKALTLFYWKAAENLITVLLKPEL